MKTLQQAIDYILNLKTPVLFVKGENFAQFDCPVYGMFEIMYSYADKKWMAYKEYGRLDEPKKQLLFYFE